VKAESSAGKKKNKKFSECRPFSKTLTFI